MADIIITGTGERIPANPGVSILNNLLQSGVKISHICGGKAICGTCRIRIISGGDSLSPIREREKNRLEGVHAGPAERLACQCHALRDVEIKILAPGKPLQ